MKSEFNFNFKDIDVKENEPLRDHSTYKIGGPTPYLIIPKTIDALINLLSTISKGNRPFLVIGRGSNILFPDEGTQKIIIKIDSSSQEFSKIELIKIRDKEYLKVGAGVLKPDLLQYALKESYATFEWLAGIPGTIGGGIKMNAGTSEGKFKDILREFTTIDSGGNFKTYKDLENVLFYRKSNIPSNEIIINGIFHIKKGNKIESEKKVNEILKLRQKKHPLNYPNAGSVFKNPPHIPAGILIDKNGLKGLRIGDAEVSTLHGNFIVNLGNAKANDVIKLINEVKTIILKKENIELEEEILIIND